MINIVYRAYRRQYLLPPFIGLLIVIALVVVAMGTNFAGTLRASAANRPTASQSSLQSISPPTCDYSLKTDYFCSLPPGSTIKLPMSAPAIVPPPGWYCIPGVPSTHITYYGGPSPTSGLTINWVSQGGGPCGAVHGYADVTVSPQARPQYLAADFFLSNVVGECKTGTNPPLCANGFADNGTRWSLNIALPQYVLQYRQQVVTKDFPNGTTPYVFPDYPPPTGPSPKTNAATVTCNVTTKVTPAQYQFSYSGNVSCNSPNGIVGRIAFNVYRVWQDRTDSDGGGVFLCSQQSYQSSCQTPTYTFQTYGNDPAVYKISVDVNLLNPINGVGLPGNVIQYTGANYQMIPYNDTNTPYPLMNPKGWNNHHLPFPDIETLPSFTYCPLSYQGSFLHPQCSAYNTPLLRSNTIAAYAQKGYAVPSGITPSSSGAYVTQYISPIECGGTTNGTNGAFLTVSQSQQLYTWWSTFTPCALQLSWNCPSMNWQGNVPPSCDNNGAFRRVYSSPGSFGATGTVQLQGLPNIPTTVASGSQAGYAYIEGWAHPNATNYEFGLAYNEVPGDSNNYNTYTVYARGPGLNWNPPGAVRLHGGDTIKLSMYAYPYAHPNDPSWPVPSSANNSCKNLNACLVVHLYDQTTGQDFLYSFVASGWDSASKTLIFARMTTIAQNQQPGDFFDDGAIFGPLLWSNVGLGQMTKTGIVPVTWDNTLAQNWPDDSTRISVTAPSGTSGEVDTIDLHP